MDKLDEDIIRFKQANMGKLPEQAQSNAQAMQTYSLQLMNTNQQLNRAAQDKLFLESQLTPIQEPGKRREPESERNHRRHDDGARDRAKPEAGATPGDHQPGPFGAGGQ